MQITGAVSHTCANNSAYKPAIIHAVIHYSDHSEHTMHTKIKMFALLLIASLVCGCDTDGADNTANVTTKGAIPEHQLRALQQAKDVENILLNAHTQQLNSVPK
jgi:hypothetical protein